MAYLVSLESAPSHEYYRIKITYLLLYIVGQLRLERASFQRVEMPQLHIKLDTHSDKMGHHSDKLGHLLKWLRPTLDTHSDKLGHHSDKPGHLLKWLRPTQLGLWLA